MARIGVVSDTHGLLRPQAVAFLQGSDFIVHAGDIGDPGILDALNAIAPVTAVRGNNDTGTWASHLAETAVLQIGAFRLLVVHDLAQLGTDPAATALDAVVSGHSHRPRIERRGGVLFVNPGSAGPRRFTLPVTIGEIIVDGRSATARTIELTLDPVARR
jgi:uncharacterized protein